MHQDNLRLFQGCVGPACTHGHSNMSDSQAGCIVDAITDHRDTPAFFRKPPDRFDFQLRFKFSPNIVEAEVALHGLSRRGTVACQHDRIESQTTESLNHFSRFWTDGVAQNDATEQFTIPDPDL